MNNIDRKLADTVYRNNFGAFCYTMFPILNPGQQLVPNWHIDAICFYLQCMVAGTRPNRVVINLPPRTLKSVIVSVLLPAWLLGRNPSTRIICVSYSEELAFKFSRETRTIMEHPIYKRIFPRTKLNPRKTTERELETTAHGFRFATSVSGTLTGRGGDVLLVDDPLKANDVGSELALSNVNEWFQNTADSRLDNPSTGLIIVTHQRLHVNDLSGFLIDRGWPSLIMPAVAMEPADFAIAESEVYPRPAGELLQPNRDTREFYEQKKQEDSRVWAAQYQQNPVPVEGNVVKAAWLRWYDGLPIKQRCQRVLSCDPAGKPGEHNDYTAISICGYDDNNNIYQLHMTRGHWTVMEICRQIGLLAREWNVELVLIEDTNSGMGVIQILRESSPFNIVGWTPKETKESRMFQHLGRFEGGRYLLPRKEFWLTDFERELLGFPLARHDDQVDALLLFLDWLSQRWREPRYETGLPIAG